MDGKRRVASRRVVVGAGAIGSTAALVARKPGASVVVLGEGAIPRRHRRGVRRHGVDPAGLRFSSLADFLDYHPVWPGAHAAGRSLETELFDATVLGNLFASLWPDARPPFTMRE